MLLVTSPLAAIMQSGYVPARVLRSSDHFQIYCSLDNPEHRAALPAACKWLDDRAKRTPDATTDGWCPALTQCMQRVHVLSRFCGRVISIQTEHTVSLKYLEPELDSSSDPHVKPPDTASHSQRCTLNLTGAVQVDLMTLPVLREQPVWAKVPQQHPAALLPLPLHIEPPAALLPLPLPLAATSAQISPCTDQSSIGVVVAVVPAGQCGSGGSLLPPHTCCTPTEPSLVQHVSDVDLQVRFLGEDTLSKVGKVICATH